MESALNTDWPVSDAGCWCIQSLRSEQPRYWAGYFFEYDTKLAVRFSRKEDAQRVITEQFSRSKAFEVYVAVQLFLE